MSHVIVLVDQHNRPLPRERQGIAYADPEEAEREAQIERIAYCFANGHKYPRGVSIRARIERLS